MHGGAYGRVRGGGGGAGNAPRLVIGFALVMAVAAFLSWCVQAERLHKLPAQQPVDIAIWP